MKLIKINEEHYIIVDSSDIKEGDFMYDIDGDIGIAIGKDKSQWEGNMKITHSTQPIDGDEVGACFTKIKQLSLLEVEELLFGYIVEISKDKLFTLEDMKKLFGRTIENAPSGESHTRMISDKEYRHFVMDQLFNKMIEPLLPKTEWEVEYIDDKLTLKQ